MFGYQYIGLKLESRNTYQGNCNFLHYMLYSDHIYMNSLLGVYLVNTVQHQTEKLMLEIWTKYAADGHPS